MLCEQKVDKTRDNASCLPVSVEIGDLVASAAKSRGPSVSLTTRAHRACSPNRSTGPVASFPSFDVFARDKNRIVRLGRPVFRPSEQDPSFEDGGMPGRMRSTIAATVSSREDNRLPADLLSNEKVHSIYPSNVNFGLETPGMYRVS